MLFEPSGAYRETSALLIVSPHGGKGLKPFSEIFIIRVVIFRSVRSRSMSRSLKMKRSWRIMWRRRRRSDITVCQPYFASIPKMLFEMFSSISGDFQALYTELKVYSVIRRWLLFRSLFWNNC